MQIKGSAVERAYNDLNGLRIEMERNREAIRAAEGVLREQMLVASSLNAEIQTEFQSIQQSLGWTPYRVFFDVTRAKWKVFDTPQRAQTQQKISVVLRFLPDSASPSRYVVVYSLCKNEVIDLPSVIRRETNSSSLASLRDAFLSIGYELVKSISLVA